GGTDEARTLYETALGGTTEAKARRELLHRLALLELGATGRPLADALAAARPRYVELLCADPANVDLRREWAEALASHGAQKEAGGGWGKPAGRARPPGGRGRAPRRGGGLFGAGGDDTAALSVSRGAFGLEPPQSPARRESAERIAGVYRRKDQLRALLAEWE